MRFAGILWICLPLLSQDPGNPVFRADSNLAFVRFNAIRGNEYVAGLKPEDIVLLEDGVPRKVAFLEGGSAAPRSVPIEIILLFDVSPSVMLPGLLKPLVFRSTLLDANPNARLSVYSFDTRLRRYLSPTRDGDDLADGLRRLSDQTFTLNSKTQEIPIQIPVGRQPLIGSTWLYEAVVGALRDASATPRNSTRMLVIFSDGIGTTTSTPEDASVVAEELGVPVYPVLLGHSALREKIDASMPQRRTGQDSGSSDTPYSGTLKGRNNTPPNRAQAGPSPKTKALLALEDKMALFASLGRLTGGRSFDPPRIDLDMIKQILAAVDAAAVNEYVATFVPESGSGDQRPHKLEVKMAVDKTVKILGGKKTVVH